MFFSIQHLLFVVCSTVIICSLSSAQLCGVTPPVWRNENRTCPPRAVCADVFDGHRDWYNGTRCAEKRTLHNCMCLGNTICPYTNDDHKIFASKKHKRYTCEPVCNFPYCANAPPQRHRGRLLPPTAVTAEQNSEEFGERTFYRIDCRCPRHHQPRRGRGVFRSVKTFTHRYDWRAHRYSTLYICDTRRDERTLPDPCSYD